MELAFPCKLGSVSLCDAGGKMTLASLQDARLIISRVNSRLRDELTKYESYEAVVKQRIKAYDFCFELGIAICDEKGHITRESIEDALTQIEQSLSTIRIQLKANIPEKHKKALQARREALLALRGRLPVYLVE